ncbi:MAG: 2,3-bisphosphoglycerate-independent phosphoglycerate mutase [Acidobacteria bacterium]|nr:2,3-bisphosphoglycerate-independent phosphoglycerate mutase [Acidobacteriota bacterium]
MNKVLYVVLDGLGDEPLAELDGRTPLEAARTPNLDRLAEGGRTGLVYTVGKGIAPESDIAVFAVLGYDPRTYHSGRGPLEALGSGMDVADGDLAYRVNFATVEAAEPSDWPHWRIVDRRVGRDLASDEARALAAEVNAAVKLPGASFELRSTVEHRGVLVMRWEGGPLSAEVTNTDPAYAREGALGVAKETFEQAVQECRPLPGNERDERARTAADLTNEFVKQAAGVLEASEVNARRRAAGKLAGNMILSRDGGDHLPRPPSFKERYGASWGCFVEMPVERGIALTLGMGEVPVAGGGGAEQYAAWARTAIEAIEGYDGLYIHIKGPDVPAHDGRARDKLEIIEAIDRAFFGELLPILRSDVVLAVTADHSTSCARKAHTDDPVPLLVWGRGISADAVATFGERAAARGSLGTLQGVEVMPLLMEAARR